MKVTFSRKDLMENSDTRNALIRIMSDAKHGGFMRIQGFRSKSGYGEVQNTTYQKGISYGAAIEKSLKMLDDIEADPNFNATVTRGSWVNANGEESPTCRKSKEFFIYKSRTETYDKSSPLMQEALDKIRQSLTSPAAPTKEYEKLGNGVYQDEEGTIYIRDLRLIKKEVVVPGNYPLRASRAVNALADVINKDMPLAKYRMFRMDGDFDKVVLGGIEVAPDEVWQS